MQKDKNWQS